MQNQAKSTAHAVVATHASSAEACLNEGATAAGLWRALEAAQARLGTSAAALRVVILPDIAALERTGVATSPALVERLIELLADRGYLNVTVAATLERAPGATSPSLDEIATKAGYHGGTTEQGHSYRLMDLSESLTPSTFPPENVLAGTPLSECWTEAHFRIVFARSRTHVEHSYALCLHTLLSVLPLNDRLFHYRQQQKPWDLCMELLQHTPIDFALIDAWQTADGLGLSAKHQQDTRSLIAGNNLLWVDWLGAVKMGLDPSASRLNAHALERMGLPTERQVEGDLSPWMGVRTVHPLVADSFRQALESGDLARWVAGVSMGSSALDQRVARLLAAAEESPASRLALATSNFALASAGTVLNCWRTLTAKEELLREVVPLGFELNTWSAADYEAVENYLLPLEQLLLATPPDANGIRWRYLEGSVLLEYTQLLPVPFDAFVSKVDIRTAISCMKDYLGGCCVPVAHDAEGRVTHQAERTRYLPQPNWLVLYGGQPIDVGKLEVVRYSPGLQRLFWRTIESANGSAQHDDGIVTFAAQPHGTQVTVLVRQQFALPPVWQAMKLELFPEVKDVLVAREYLAYFQETMTNFQMRYEGLDFRIGHDANPSDVRSPRLATATKVVRSTATALGTLLRKAVGTPGTKPPQRDSHGFRHFEPTVDEPGVGSRRSRILREAVSQGLSSGQSAKTFLKDFAAAVRADLSGKEG